MKQADAAARLRQLDVVFVIDTTGSMGPAIATVQAQLKTFAQALAGADFQPSVAFGAVAFRDHPPEDVTYIVRVYPLVEDLEQAQANVNRFLAAGGGDGAEAVLDGLHAALHGIEPRPGAHRVVLLVGDAPPHGAGGGHDHWPLGCPCGLTITGITRDAVEQGVTVHAVGVGHDPAMLESFAQIAGDTGGEFVALEQLAGLAPRVLALLRAEVAKMAADSAVFSALERAPQTPAATLAAILGRTTEDVAASLARLRAKGIISVDGMAVTELLNVLLSVEPAAEGVDVGLAEVEPDVLARIRIDDGTDEIPRGALGEAPGRADDVERVDDVYDVDDAGDDIEIHILAG